MKKFIKFAVTHGLALVVGFVLGVYLLPILTAPKSPDVQMIEKASEDAMFTATLTRDLKGSDFLHWGEGTVSLTRSQIVHSGKLSPGPDYKLYLTKDFVQHEDEFRPIKDSSQYIGDVKSFDGFILDIPDGVKIEDYSGLIVWCGAFSEFITAAQYRE